ncbi:uncharacterized protein [Leptinotarsa decemlineata]|uniref:uncharacterized protein n=1 Tax=Leptinotarsa decemlineata TaxID=7539 RepID=UPI003D30A759
MDVRWFSLPRLILFFCGFTSVLSQRGFTICDLPGCDCIVKAASWKVVNCSLLDGQLVNFEETTIPKEALEIYITGGEEIIFAAKTFNALPGLTLIEIKRAGKIVMEKKSFYNINSSSLLIQIRNCDEIVIRTGAFEYVQCPVSTEIFDILYINIEQAAFSKLYNGTFKNVKKMRLQEKSFDFKNQGHIGRLGPVAVIIFDNVTIPEIPREVFLKPLASVSFHNSVIGDIHTDAFKAAEISSISIVGTVLNRIHEGAFTGRTLICDFKISKCNISKLQTRSIMAAVGNFTLSHSIITDIEPRAIMTTVAKVEIIGNQIFNFNTRGTVFNNWNKINIDDNIIKRLYPNFVEASAGPENEKLSFKGNEIYTTDEGALSFLSQLDDKFIIFDDNFFNQSCNCSIDEWVESITNNSQKVKLVMDTSFCPVDEFLSRCFSLPVGIINIQNFTEKTCVNFTVCEPYEGKTRVVDTTSKIFLPEDDSAKQSWLIFMITVVSLFILAILVTFIILLVRGGRWLKENGYFRNMHYANNELSNDDEGTIVTLDDNNERLKIPEDLTMEFLQVLSVRLDDPNTHQEAAEMIERLYDMFIVDDGYENNNRQEEEAHLYEELGNLNLQIPPPPYEEDKEVANGPRSILRLIEEKVNQQADDGESSKAKVSMMGVYSEPSDAKPISNLYDFLKDGGERTERRDSKDTMKSNGSTGSRPLPSTPKEAFDIEAGPSTKF